MRSMSLLAMQYCKTSGDIYGRKDKASRKKRSKIMELLSGGGVGGTPDTRPDELLPDNNNLAEMRRSSYYVLFLGAKESKGLRGTNYIEPVLHYFLSRESRMQALKVTLQVGSKGLKLIPVHQKVTTGEALGHQQTDKYFIPHHAITCVFQAPPPNDDIVACILLIYNPDTRCPVHVQVYRCDSTETATTLREQLEGLVNREENQRKFRDIECRLESKGLLPPPSRTDTPDFDSRTTTTSDSSDNSISDRGFSSSEKIATLYDSLAAELREKLTMNNGKRRNSNQAPLLLPPRDYDTMHRQRGNLVGIDSRRCSNPALVGVGGRVSSYRKREREQDSCGRSSGIGSAEDNTNYAPDGDPSHAAGIGGVPSSSDDEDWNPSSLVVTENMQFLVRPMWATTTSNNTTLDSCSTNRSNNNHNHPPPLPKRLPEMMAPRQREGGPPPPPLLFSREKFEGVKQKWEKLDHHQYNNNVGKQQGMGRSHPHDKDLDNGVAVEADYRQQLSRESLLRSLRTGSSRDSLDRWVEAGVRSSAGPRLWRSKLDAEEAALIPQHHPSTNPNGNTPPLIMMGPLGLTRGPSPGNNTNGSKLAIIRSKLHSTASLGPDPNKGGGLGIGNNKGFISNTNTRQRSKGYRELDDGERYPGLDKDTARLVHHSTSSLNNLLLSHKEQQHIYSEPNFDSPPPLPPNNNGKAQKHKKFSFAFWK